MAPLLLGVLVMAGVLGGVIFGLPGLIRLAEYLLAGQEKVYVLLPLMAALAMSIYVFFLAARDQRHRLFTVFILSFPLISTLHRRVELNVFGMHIYIETVLVLLLTVYLWHHRRLAAHRLTALLSCMLVLLVGALLSLVVNQVTHPSTIWYLVQENLLPFALFLMACAAVRHRLDMDRFLRALMLSLALFAVLSLTWVFVLDQTIGLDVGEVLSAQTRISGGVRRFLVGAGFVNSEVGNRVFMLLVPVAVVMIRGRALQRANLLPYAIILVSTYFIIATEHRAALLGGIIVLLLFIVFGRTRNIKAWMKLAVLGLVLFFLHDKVLDYLNRRILLDESFMMDGSAQKRLVMWSFALNLVRDHPWLGIGPLQYLPAAMNTRAQAITPHNYYVTILTEQGLVGILAYLGVVGTIFARGLLNVRRLGEPYLKRLNFGILTGLFYYQFVLFFGGGRLTHNNAIYIHGMFWLVAALLWMLPRFEEDAWRMRAAATAPSGVRPAAGSGRPAPPVPALPDGCGPDQDRAAGSRPRRGADAPWPPPQGRPAPPTPSSPPLRG
ncbi:MAG: O-antigen ligase family protein [bacterium]|jgi:putative inorganic carbon (HCO3(-)) transporter|nr:O-antigen ligase family protein [bacterium]